MLIQQYIVILCLRHYCQYVAKIDIFKKYREHIVIMAYVNMDKLQSVFDKKAVSKDTALCHLSVKFCETDT